MKPILNFPKIIILTIVLSLHILHYHTELVQCESQPESLGQPIVKVPFSPEYDPTDFSYEGSWPSEEIVDHVHGERSARSMYLAQGVEFVFPIGVQYTLANVNEQLWPVGTTGFDSVLEFPKNKIAIMFSSMVNTLKIANFTVSSRIYSPDKKEPTTPLRILGTELQSADFRNNYKDTWATMNKDVSLSTGGAIPEFIPRGGLYGRSIYPFTTATFINTIQYQNHWAFPWRQGLVDRFTDSPLVPYLEVEGLMPFYENDAFIAVAALFRSGTGSVVFLKPKGSITILQLMLNPTALTQIFDENFPGWGVKQMRVRVPEAAFTTNTQHHDMLVKRGVTKSFCVNETPNQGGQDGNRFSLNPIVQTNHIRIARDTFAIASVTGVTLNNEKDLNQWNVRQRDDMAPETLLEEYTTPKEGEDEAQGDSTTQVPSGDEDVIIEEEVFSTTTASESSSAEERSDLASLSLILESDSDVDSSNTQKQNQSSTVSNSKVVKVGTKTEEVDKFEKKAPETFTPPADVYEFNEPFLWFLHAINEEPMFMGVVESFKRYLEETGNKENVQHQGPQANKASSSVIDKNGWIYEAAKGVLWHCPSSLQSKQADEPVAGYEQIQPPLA